MNTSPSRFPRVLNQLLGEPGHKTIKVKRCGHWHNSIRIGFFMYLFLVDNHVRVSAQIQFNFNRVIAKHRGWSVKNSIFNDTSRANIVEETCPTYPLSPLQEEGTDTRDPETCSAKELYKALLGKMWRRAGRQSCRLPTK